MKQEMKTIVWEWLPGFIAGLIPLIVFSLVSSQMAKVDLPDNHPALHIFRNGLTAHLLVFAIVTGSVSTFTAFPRLFVQSRNVTLADGEHFGMGALLLVMVITVLLTLSVSLYTMQEARVIHGSMLWLSIMMVVPTIITSFYIEMAIANARSAAAAARRAGATKPEPEC